MDKEEIKDYLKRVDELGAKLTEEDKETLQWLIFGYNQCAKLLNETKQQCKKQKEVIKKAIEYLNKYAWQEDIIGGIYTTTGKPAIDRYMQLEWDNCNELLDILKEVE